MKMLKLEGRASIVVPEGVLFQTNNAFTKVKQTLLENFNVHTIVSLPSGVFLPYSGVKTNILYFDRKGATNDIWYYDVTPPYKLTKNKPIAYEHIKEFIHLFHHPEERNQTNAKVPVASSDSQGTSELYREDCNDWTVNIKDIKDYDLSAKNPHKVVEVIHKSPKDLLKAIKQNDTEINTLMNQIESLIDG
jgi:type I restriction enzyme M protein